MRSSLYTWIAVWSETKKSIYDFWDQICILFNDKNTELLEGILWIFYRQPIWCKNRIIVWHTFFFGRKHCEKCAKQVGYFFIFHPHNGNKYQVQKWPLCLAMPTMMVFFFGYTIYCFLRRKWVHSMQY
jgi:hypothetical protein